MANEKTRRGIEYEWYAQRPSVSYPPNARLSDMQRIYWAKTVGADVNKITATDLQWLWLKSLTGVTSKFLPDMWREAVIGIGKTPAPSLEENRWIYYQFA